MATTLASTAEVCAAARRAARELAQIDSGRKDAALEAIAAALHEHSAEILAANAIDMQLAREADIGAALLDRLRLDEQRVWQIAAAVRHDYAAFAARELPARERLDYPPFASMIRIVVRGERQDLTQQFADAIAARLRTAFGGVEPSGRVLGPAPAPIGKLRGQFRFQIQAQSVDLDALRSAVRAATAACRLPHTAATFLAIKPCSSAAAAPPVLSIS